MGRRRRRRHGDPVVEHQRHQIVQWVVLPLLVVATLVLVLLAMSST